MDFNISQQAQYLFYLNERMKDIKQLKAQRVLEPNNARLVDLITYRMNEYRHLLEAALKSLKVEANDLGAIPCDANVLMLSDSDVMAGIAEMEGIEYKPEQLN